MVVRIVVGGAAIGFRELLGLIQLTGFGSPLAQVQTLAGGFAWWHLLLVPAGGGLLTGLFIHFVFPGRAPLGVAQVIEAGAVKDGHMPFVQGISATAISAASLGVGASAGREGPMVHLGATLAAQAACLLRLNPSLSLTLLGCGVAAGVAASFNAPLAGMILRDRGRDRPLRSAGVRAGRHCFGRRHHRLAELLRRLPGLRHT